MVNLTNVLRKLRERNLLTAVLLIDVFFTFFFVIDPVMIFIDGDLDFLLSLIIGFIFISKTTREEQNGYYLRLKTGVFGALLSSISAIVISLVQQGIIGTSEVFQMITIFILLGQLIGLLIAGLSILIFHFRSRL